MSNFDGEPLLEIKIEECPMSPLVSYWVVKDSFKICDLYFIWITHIALQLYFLTVVQ